MEKKLEILRRLYDKATQDEQEYSKATEGQWRVGSNTDLYRAMAYLKAIKILEAESEEEARKLEEMDEFEIMHMEIQREK